MNSADKAAIPCWCSVPLKRGATETAGHLSGSSRRKPLKRLRLSRMPAFTQLKLGVNESEAFDTAQPFPSHSRKACPGRDRAHLAWSASGRKFHLVKGFSLPLSPGIQNEVSPI
jgi:hypothetical protein